MKKIATFGEEAARIEHLTAIAEDLGALDGTWCIVGRHLVPIGIGCRTTQRGTMVCPACANTAAGRKALTPFDPTR